MKTHTSKRAIWLRSLLLLPLLAVLVYGFSTTEVLQKNPEKTEIAKEKATKAEIAEYNKLAKKYNAVVIENRIIPLEDLKVLETIYRKMTAEQKAKAEAFPECPPPPAPPSPPAPKSPEVPEPPEAAEAPKAATENYFTVPEAPPAPNANPVEYIKELAKKGARFYIGPHEYTADEAIEMLQKNNNPSIDVSNYPIVKLDGC